MKVAENMKYVCATLFASLFCIGCGRDERPSKNSVPKDVPSTTERYPTLEWTEAVVSEHDPESGEPELLEVHGSTTPVNVLVLQKCFRDPVWTEAKNPEFTVWQTENDFARVIIAPDSKKFVAKVKTTKMFDSGPMRGDVSTVRIRTTKPFANEGEVLTLLEAYLKQDGTFETLVRWSDANNNER